MKFTLERSSNKVAALVNDQFCRSGTIAFVVQCNDGRVFVTFGDYYEKSALPELFSRIASELPGASHQEIKWGPPEWVRDLQRAAERSANIHETERNRRHRSEPKP